MEMDDIIKETLSLFVYLLYTHMKLFLIYLLPNQEFKKVYNKI